MKMEDFTQLADDAAKYNRLRNAIISRFNRSLDNFNLERKLLEDAEEVIDRIRAILSQEEPKQENQIVLHDKEYDGESIVDVSRDVWEAFDEKFNPEVKKIPKNEHYIQEGTFKVTVTWHS